MQARTRYPLQYRLLLGLGGVLLAAFILLIFTPLLQAYSLAFGIPLLMELAFAMAAAAMPLLYLGLSLGGGLGCAGLLLKWMSRHGRKRKRKQKRLFTPKYPGRLAIAGRSKPAARPLAEARAIRRITSDHDLRLGLCEPAARDPAAGRHSKR